jgi:ABC-2 type transport system permease protein
MKRHIRLYMAFLRNCLRQAAEFRVNFWVNLATNIGWMGSIVVFLEVIFHNTKSVHGWTEPEMFVLFGTYSLLRGISNTLFYSNLSQLPDFIRMGTMDFILTKPVNSQFYVSLRYVSLDDLGQSLGAVFVIGYGWLQLHRGLPTLPAVGAYFLLLAFGLVLFYALNMILMTLAFWLVRLDNLMVLADTVFQIARTPVDIFSKINPIAPLILSYVLPLAFLAAIPVKALFGNIEIGHALLAALLLAFLFLWASILLWRQATRSYSSASS